MTSLVFLMPISRFMIVTYFISNVIFLSTPQ